MAKDKKDKNPKEFKNSPFKQLKGFSALEKAPAPAVVRPVPVPGSRVAPEEEGGLFEAEMKLLGVSPTEPGGTEREIPEVQERPCKLASSVPREPQTEEELFLCALGKMDSRFADAFPEGEPVAAESRRMKLVMKAKLFPEHKVDLHGLTREEALARVAFFLEDARYQGCKLVLLVTGQGRGSGGEPIIRAAVEQYLQGKGASLAAEWSRAPRHLGGDGALVVFLKS